MDRITDFILVCKLYEFSNFLIYLLDDYQLNDYMYHHRTLRRWKILYEQPT